MESENVTLDIKENKIKEINKLGELCKSNLLKDAVLNSVLLLLIAVFFSILFEFTKKIVIDFVNLSWGDIFPMLLDFGALIIIIITIKSIKTLLSGDNLVLDLNENEENVSEKIEFFLQEKSEDLTDSLVGLIIFSVVYFLVVEALEVINNKFSMLNSWYFDSFYESLPIYPLNIVMLVIIFAILFPMNKAIYKYRKTLSSYLIKQDQKKHFQNSAKESIETITVSKRLILLALMMFCIALSFLKQNNLWNFKYLKSNELLNITINEQTKIQTVDIKLLCTLKREYPIIHNKIKFSYYNNNSNTLGGSELITEQTKEDLENYCNKINK